MAYIQQRGPRLFVVQISTGTGAARVRRTALVHGTYQQAVRRAVALEAELGTAAQAAQTAAAAPRGPTLGAWLTTWQREDVARLAATTQSGYRLVLDRLRREQRALLDTPLDALPPAALRAWEATLRAAGLAPSTRALHRRVLRTAVRAAVRRGLLAPGADPFQAAPGAQPGRRRTGEDRAPPRAVLSRQQAAALLAALDGLAGVERHDWRALWWTALLTGLRLGELRGLRVPDVDVERAEARITQQITEARGRPIRGVPKSSRPRVVPLPPPLVAVLRDHLADVPPDQTLLFSPGGDVPFSTGQARKVLYRLEGAAGLPERITPHGLRHSFATLALAAGVDLAYVSWWLGHAGIAITRDLYARYVPEAGQREAARLGTFLVPAGEPTGPKEGTMP